jgi:Na+/alanine symporter
MRIFVGLLVVLFGLGLVAASGALGDATQRSNVAFTKGRAFAGPGWATYNRFIYRLVGAVVVIGGVAYASGLLQ